MQLDWSDEALEDRRSIMEYIAVDSISAALAMDEKFPVLHSILPSIQEWAGEVDCRIQGNSRSRLPTYLSMTHETM